MKREFVNVRWRKRRSIYPPFVIFRAKKDGGPLLKTEARRIRDINGFMLMLGREPRILQLTVEFRRRGRG